jgi:hypothetical protein
VATDVAPEQIAVAQEAPDPRIEFRVAAAEASGIEPTSVDLVTVAQAVHWFDIAAFSAEVARVMRVGGVLAVWCYRTPVVGHGIDPLVEGLYNAPCLASLWSERRRYIDTGYAGIRLPFREIAVPAYTIEDVWGWARFERYLRTWQAVGLAAADRPASEFVNQQFAALAAAWGAADVTRPVRWQLWVRACIKDAEPAAEIG